MGVRLRFRDQTAKCGMAHEKFSFSEESTHEQIQGENYDCFFSDSRGIVHKKIVPSGQQLITPSTKMSWNDFLKGPASPKGHCRRLGAATR